MARVEIAFKADLTLVVRGTLELRVSSGVLMTTSEVFRAMLGPKFREGLALQSASMGESVSIPLPDGDQEDMKHLCAALHNRNDLLPATMDCASLRYFAEIVDKYACLESLRFVGRAYFAKLAPSDHRAELDFLHAAYLFDDPAAFAYITNLQGRTYCKDYDCDVFQPNDGYFEGYIARLTQTRGRAYNELCSKIARHAAEVFDFTAPQVGQHAMRKAGSCNAVKQIAKAYLHELRAEQIWLSPAQHGTDLPMLLQRIDIFDSGFLKNHIAALCRTCDKTIVTRIEQGLNSLKSDAKQLFAGFCLDCFKAGRRTGCRVKHD